MAMCVEVVANIVVICPVVLIFCATVRTGTVPYRIGTLNTWDRVELKGSNAPPPF